MNKVQDMRNNSNINNNNCNNSRSPLSRIEKRIKSPLPPALLEKFIKRKDKKRIFNRTIGSEGFIRSKLTTNP